MQLLVQIDLLFPKIPKYFVNVLQLLCIKTSPPGSFPVCLLSSNMTKKNQSDAGTRKVVLAILNFPLESSFRFFHT